MSEDMIMYICDRLNVFKTSVIIKLCSAVLVLDFCHIFIATITELNCVFVCWSHHFFMERRSSDFGEFVCF